MVRFAVILALAVAATGCVRSGFEQPPCLAGCAPEPGSTADGGSDAALVDGQAQRDVAGSDAPADTDASHVDGGVPDRAAVDRYAAWVGLGDSDFGPQYELTMWGSASGGGISHAVGGSDMPSLAISSAGGLFVAWQDNMAGTFQIYVERYDGSDWVEVGAGSASGGGISQSSATAYYPALALDSSGLPVVAWSDGASGNNEIYVKRFDGASWIEVGAGAASNGGISQNSGASSAPVMALASDNPVVAWTDNTAGNSEIYVKRFDGASWVEVGAGSASTGGISQNGGNSSWLALALDTSGLPAVAWEDDSAGNFEIYVKRFNGTSWTELGAGSAGGGGISQTSGASRRPALRLDGSGDPIVAWHDETTGNADIYVKRYNGSAWVEWSPGSASGGGISQSAGYSQGPALALDAQGNPFVAWADGSSASGDIYVKHGQTDGWAEVGAGSASAGGISQSAGYSGRCQLALDVADHPVVVWEDDTAGNTEIYIKRFDGASWVELGAGSASGGGISQTTGFSMNPALALEPSGNPVVVWSDQSAGSSAIYLKRFDGSSWVELGAGSASNGGMSQSARWSSMPKIAITAAGTPVVAWHDVTARNSEIYVRQYRGGSWVELGAGSASNGGVSNTSASINGLALGVRAGRACVAWSEQGQSATEIVMRCAVLEN